MAEPEITRLLRTRHLEDYFTCCMAAINYIDPRRYEGYEDFGPVTMSGACGEYVENLYKDAFESPEDFQLFMALASGTTHPYSGRFHQVQKLRNSLLKSGIMDVVNGALRNLPEVERKNFARQLKRAVCESVQDEAVLSFLERTIRSVYPEATIRLVENKMQVFTRKRALEQGEGYAVLIEINDLARTFEMTPI